MSREIEAIKYLPEYMAELREIKELYKGIQPELNGAYATKDICFEECFVLLAGSFGIERLEKMLQIVPLPTDTIEDRRLRILAALNGDTPYTFKTIYQKLVLLCGEGNVNMDYAKEIYTLRVVLQLKAKNQFETVKKMLKRMLPCNISLKCSLAYNRHRDLAKFSHGQLKAFTHKMLYDEVLGDKGEMNLE